MTEKIQGELEYIHREVVDMGAFALKMLRDSIDAFERGDAESAQEISARKDELKRRFVSIEEAVFQHLALYQPVAKDMRFTVSAIRIIYNLERIGRMGFDIAETIMVLSRCCGLIEPADLITMGKMVCLMIEDAMKAFEKRSLSEISTMRARDKEVDALYCKIMGDLIQKMKDDISSVPVLTRYVIIDRYLERCGDQACNIAEMTVYMVTGERVEIS